MMESNEFSPQFIPILIIVPLGIILTMLYMSLSEHRRQRIVNSLLCWRRKRHQLPFRRGTENAIALTPVAPMTFHGCTLALDSILQRNAELAEPQPATTRRLWGLTIQTHLPRREPEVNDSHPTLSPTQAVTGPSENPADWFEIDLGSPISDDGVGQDRTTVRF
jgi:hypothetical protein